VSVIINGVIASILLTTTIGTIVQGVKVKKILAGLPMGKAGTLRKMNLLLISAASVMISTLAVIIIWTLIRSLLWINSYSACQTAHLTYRVVEIACIAILTVPLRTILTRGRGESSGEMNRTPSQRSTEGSVRASVEMTVPSPIEDESSKPEFTELPM
jgi:hypothetical protein